MGFFLGMNVCENHFDIKKDENLKRRTTMKDYQTYIFDLDGTLLNTLADLAASTNAALLHYGMPERSTDEVRRFVGNGVRKLMERAIPDGAGNPLFEEVFSFFRQHYLVHSLDTTCPYEGIQDLLSELRKRGKRVAIVSNKLHAATVALAQHFFSDTVDVAIGENEAAGIRKKPAPDTVVEALRRLGVHREDAVYVGDSDVDIQTARNSGMPCISVLWGFRDKQFLLDHGATTLVAKPTDILA